MYTPLCRWDASSCWSMIQWNLWFKLQPVEIPLYSGSGSLNQLNLIVSKLFIDDSSNISNSSMPCLTFHFVWRTFWQVLCAITSELVCSSSPKLLLADQYIYIYTYIHLKSNRYYDMIWSDMIWCDIDWYSNSNNNSHSNSNSNSNSNGDVNSNNKRMVI